MRSVVGSMPIVIGLLMVSGCVLPDQSIGKNDSFRFPGKRASKSKIESDPSTSDKLAFKAPKRSLRSKKNDDSASSDIAEGSSSDPKDDKESLDRKSSNSPGKENGELASTDSNRSPVKQINGLRSDGDTESPIQLQGLEFDTTETSAPPTGLQASARSESVTVDMTKNPLASNQPSSESGKQPQTASGHSADLNRGQRADDKSVAAAAIAPVNQTNHVDTPTDFPRSGSADVLKPTPWQSELNQLIARIEQKLARSSSETDSESQIETLRSQAHLRLLYLMAQRQEDALSAIPNLTPSQQEYWQQMIWAMFNSLDTNHFPEQAERAAHTVSPLSAALRHVREEAPLSIKNMAFCRKISYFGNYDRFPRNDFTPGYEVLLYTEIENFVSSPTGDGEYRTSLKSTIEIADSKGNTVWTKGFAPTEDFCRNPRRDYFHNYQFHIPEDLATGEYSLKLTISDELSHKKASNSLKFSLK